MLRTTRFLFSNHGPRRLPLAASVQVLSGPGITVSVTQIAIRAMSSNSDATMHYIIEAALPHLPPDLTFVKTHEGSCHIFEMDAKLVACTYNYIVHEWGTRTLTPPEIIKTGLPGHKFAGNADQKTTVLNRYFTRGENSTAGLLESLWGEISNYPRRSRRREKFMTDSELVSYLSRLLLQLGVAVRPNVVRSLALRRLDSIAQAAPAGAEDPDIDDDSSESESDTDTGVVQVEAGVGPKGGTGTEVDIASEAEARCNEPKQVTNNT